MGDGCKEMRDFMWHLIPKPAHDLSGAKVYVLLAKLPIMQLNLLTAKLRQLLGHVVKQPSLRRSLPKTTALHQALLSLLVGMFCSVVTVVSHAEDGVAPTPSSYTLIIRMTPAVCALDPELQKLRQCQDGFTLTISSLQAERLGKRLENCSRDQTNLSPLQERVVERVMPDKELRDEDWQKNGSCTGMTPTTYFRTIATYAQRLKIPSELASPRDTVLTKSYIINRLEQLNPGLTEKSILLRCTPDASHDLPILTELRSCYNTSGQYDACPAYVKSNCPASVVIHGSP